MVKTMFLMPLLLEDFTIASSSQPSPDSNGTSTPASRTCSINDTADRGMLAPYIACGLELSFFEGGDPVVEVRDFGREVSSIYSST